MSPDDAEESTPDGDEGRSGVHVAASEHVRPTSEGYTPGIYRVVGAGDPVALLRLTDENGRREFTGDLAVVDRVAVEDDFEPADDPDDPADVILEFRNVVSGMYWTVRGLLPR